MEGRAVYSPVPEAATSRERSNRGRGKGPCVDKTSVDELRAIGLFGGLADEALEFLSASTTATPLLAGFEVFREGDPPSAIHVVLQGELELVRKTSDGREVRLALLHPRDWFGEVGLLDMCPRSATVRTLAPCLLLPIPASLLHSLYRRDLKAYSLFLLNLTREMCRRMRVLDAQLVEAMAASSPQG